MSDLSQLSHDATKIANQASELASKIAASEQMSQANDASIFSLTIFILSCFIGYYVVWRVTPALHTPLMSVTNAISGIIILGSLLAMNSFDSSSFLGFIATIFAAINIFGGFVVTYRMLAMFKKK